MAQTPGRMAFLLGPSLQSEKGAQKKPQQSDLLKLLVLVFTEPPYPSQALARGRPPTSRPLPPPALVLTHGCQVRSRSPKQHSPAPNWNSGSSRKTPPSPRLHPPPQSQNSPQPLAASHGSTPPKFCTSPPRPHPAPPPRSSQAQIRNVVPKTNFRSKRFGHNFRSKRYWHPNP